MRTRAHADIARFREIQIASPISRPSTRKHPGNQQNLSPPPSPTSTTWIKHSLTHLFCAVSPRLSLFISHALVHALPADTGHCSALTQEVICPGTCLMADTGHCLYWHNFPHYLTHDGPLQQVGPVSTLLPEQTCQNHLVCAHSCYTHI